MSIIIKNKFDDEFILSMDRYGNVYFATSQNPQVLYDLNINNRNEIECFKYHITYDSYEPVDYQCNDFEYQIGRIKSTKNQQKLKQKIEKKVSQNPTNFESDDESDDLNYFQENDDFEESEIDLEADFPFFSFNFVDQKIDIHDREQIHALYDTIVYCGNPNTFELILKSTLHNDFPLFRLIIYTNGDIKFRPIGQNPINYQIILDNGEICLKRLLPEEI